MGGFPPVGTWSWLPRTARRGSFIQTTSRLISLGSCASSHDSLGLLSARMARAPAGARVPGRAVTAQAQADLPLFTDLLRVRDLGGAAARDRRRTGPRSLAHSALQPAGRRRI